MMIMMMMMMMMMMMIIIISGYVIWCAHKKITSKRRELKKTKKTNYRQLAFELRERRPGFKVRVVPLVISAFGVGIKETIKNWKIFLKQMICAKRLLPRVP